MRTKTKLARQHAAEQEAALLDARALVFELGGYAPVVTFDPMKAGVVLADRETAYRYVAVWLRQWFQGTWDQAEWCQARA